MTNEEMINNLEIIYESLEEEEPQLDFMHYDLLTEIIDHLKTIKKVLIIYK